MRLLSLACLLCIVLAGCATDQQAPVVERTPTKQPPAKSLGKPAPSEKDWRPEVYTVKRGDTLYAIGLEHGYDYKELAQANDIPPPYVIHVGQQLKFKEIKSPAPAGDTKIEAVKNEAEADVVITPLSIESVVTPKPADDIPLLSEPKAIREPYSPQALAAVSVVQSKSAADAVNKPVEAAKPEPEKPIAAAKSEAPKTEVTTGDDEAIEWKWPTNGKIVAGFNDAASIKGIDIAGTPGQAVLAAAPGKVIYSGADLRGYGKLVIIKHNKTYLSVYAHNSQILVKEGQQVAKGQKIAEMGSSDTDRTKLHFEIRRQGKSVDPSKYLSGEPN